MTVIDNLSQSIVCMSGVANFIVYTSIVLICILEIVQCFTSETVMLYCLGWLRKGDSYYFMSKCTYILNIMSVALLDALHSESESLLPLVEIEHRSDFWQWPLRVQHRVSYM